VVSEYYTRTDGSLLHQEVYEPKALYIDNNASELWVVNGTDEICSINLGTLLPKRFLPATGIGYKLSNVTDVRVKQMYTPLGYATSGSITTGEVFPLPLAPGDTFEGKVDGGATYTFIIQATRAVKDGVAATYNAVPAGSHLDVVIDGVAGTQVLSFLGTENSQATYLNRINAQILGGSAIVNGTQVRIQTDRFGSSAVGQILASSSPAVLNALGLTASNFTNPGPNNVADASLVTAAEMASLHNLTFTNSRTIVSSTSKAYTWSSNITGTTSSVQYVGGTGLAKVPGLDTAVHVGSGLGAQAVNENVLYVANGAYGNIVTFSIATGRVIHTFGIRSLEDNALSQNPVFYGNAGAVSGVLPDLINIDGTSSNVIIVSDEANRRVYRLNEDSFNVVNECVFRIQSYAVPIRLRGWSLVGTVPSGAVKVEYRFFTNEPWHILDPCSSTTPSTNLQFKITVTQRPELPIAPSHIRQLVIIGEQA